MLRVPELKSGEEPFDPEFTRHPGTGFSSFPDGHTLSVFGKMENGTLGRDGLLTDAISPPADQQKKVAAVNLEYQESLKVKSLLRHGMIKDAITNLHREDDAQMAKLEQYDAARIADIPRDHERFLAAQEEKYGAMFADESQRRLFREMTRGYCAHSLMKAKALRNRKASDYLGQAIERQNDELVQRALLPENLFNDEMQTGYRNMILHNHETLLQETGGTERRAKLDAVSNMLYRKILDARLEADPEQLRRMLDAPEIRRVLGKAAVAEYEKKIESALQEMAMRAESRDLAEGEAPPEEARKFLRQKYPDAENSLKAERYYRNYRHAANSSRYLTAILNAANTWKIVMESGLREESIPNWVHRNDPALLDFLLSMLETRRRDGGFPGTPDYCRLLDFAADFAPEEVAEELRTETAVYELMLKLGGPDAGAFEAVLRLVMAKSSEKDRAWFADLRLAAQCARAEFGEKMDAGIVQHFLAGFDVDRRLRMEREGVDRLEEAKIRELIAANLQWYGAASASTETQADSDNDSGVQMD